MKFENRAFKFLPALLFLSSCGFNNNIKYGFSGSFSEHIVPVVRTACVGKKTQNTNNVLFEVYAGHQDTFVDEWNNNIFGFNPGVGCFAINRVILNKDNIVISNEFVSLPDFPSKKYIFTFNNKNHNLYKSYFFKLDKIYPSKWSALRDISKGKSLKFKIKFYLYSFLLWIRVL